MKSLRFGLIFPSYKDYVDPQLLREAASRAEQNGFEIFLLWDHYLLPDTRRTLEAYEALSFLSALTKEIHLGTVVTPLPLRNVRVLAKLTSFLDFLSDHRFVLGLGLGWHKPEFEYFSEWRSGKARLEMTHKGIEDLRKMWTGSGRHDLPQIEPRPDSGLIPIWIGARGPRTVELCGKTADGWIPNRLSPQEYERRSRTIREHLRGASNKKRNKSFVFAFASEDEKVSKRTSSQLAKTIQSYQDSGVRLFCETWNFDPRDKHEFLKRIDWYRSDVMSTF